ncbi:hypothetical protein [Anabaena sp. CCY 0017]|uniref:hypothetical protein n=1 Tax=Anabaena sp. CCY 0017 TaxID=3103866 RepID=UPI0039C613C9
MAAGASSSNLAGLFEPTSGFLGRGVDVGASGRSVGGLAPGRFHCLAACSASSCCWPHHLAV